jgi:hypothetical protein
MKLKDLTTVIMKNNVLWNVTSYNKLFFPKVETARSSET